MLSLREPIQVTPLPFGAVIEVERRASLGGTCAPCAQLGAVGGGLTDRPAWQYLVAGAVVLVLIAVV